VGESVDEIAARVRYADGVTLRTLLRRLASGRKEDSRVRLIAAGDQIAYRVGERCIWFRSRMNRRLSRSSCHRGSTFRNTILGSRVVNPRSSHVRASSVLSRPSQAMAM